MKSRTVFWLVGLLMVLALRQQQRWNTQSVFDWDAGGYFSYLPAVFSYHDPGRVDSLAQLVQQRLPESEHDYGRLGIHRLWNGRYFSKYPLGVALGQLPWFLGAHAYSYANNMPTTGHTWPYQMAITLTGAFHALIGLWVVRKLLLRYYSDRVTAWAIAGIGLGTNYFVYATNEAATAHAALFMWQASMLYCTARWYETPERRWALGMGLFLGLAVLTRFSEAMYVLIPLTWGLSSWAAVRQRPRLLAQHAGQLALAAGLGLAVISLQFFFWHWVGGQWVLKAYENEYFDFTQPHLLDGLFSIRRGWFVYTPLAALMLAGVVWLRRYVPAAVPVILVLLPILLYVTFCWWQWWYGWGFSTRPLVSLYPLLSLPLGAALATVSFKGRWRQVTQTFVLACIALSLWQGWQYATVTVPGDNVTWEIYKEGIFKRPPLYPAQPTPYTPPPKPTAADWEK